MTESCATCNFDGSFKVGVLKHATPLKEISPLTYTQLLPRFQTEIASQCDVVQRQKTRNSTT